MSLTGELLYVYGSFALLLETGFIRKDVVAFTLNPQDKVEA
jgi:hypothetical protein